MDEVGLVPVQKRKDSVILNLTCEILLKKYQHGMGGVDHGDEYQEIGAGFASKLSAIIGGICHLMLLNSYFAWNILLTESNVKG